MCKCCVAAHSFDHSEQQKKRISSYIAEPRHGMIFYRFSRLFLFIFYIGFRMRIFTRLNEFYFDPNFNTLLILEARLFLREFDEVGEKFHLRVLPITPDMVK